MGESPRWESIRRHRKFPFLCEQSKVG